MDTIGALDALESTRAIRRFTADPIPLDDLNRMLFAATRAPSGSNRQPFRLVVLRDGQRAVQAKELLQNTFRAGWDQKRTKDGHDKAQDGTPRARMAAAMQHFVDHFDQIPVVVLACITPRHGDLIDGASVYPACQNLLIAARSLGYGGVLTGWHLGVEDELKSVCEIPDAVRVAAVIPLGVPAGRHGPVRRRPLPDLVFDDGWGESASWIVDPPGTRFTG